MNGVYRKVCSQFVKNIVALSKKINLEIEASNMIRVAEISWKGVIWSGFDITGEADNRGRRKNSHPIA